MPKLVRADTEEPGITRRGRGRGFEYVDEATGQKITDPDTLQRIKDLVIPPAWKDVWVCPDPHGHIQVLGTDEAGRRQYRYHEAWREQRDREKFSKMSDFARALPRLREACDALLDDPTDLRRGTVLACAARLLDHGFFRIGSECYAEQNDSYGLATMRKEHVIVSGDTVVFDYAGKSGKRRVQSVVNPAVAEVVRRLKRRRGGGEELLAYKDEDAAWRDVTSADINDWIKLVLGEEFSAKDFRTWNATVLAAVALAVSGEAVTGSETAKKRAVTRAVQEVAHYLGNTPAVCRSSYIDPRVIERFSDGWTIAGVLDELGGEAAWGRPVIQGAVERAVLDLLEERSRSEFIEKAG
ncbi:MAG TPA: hypothetical protein VNU01_08290 [Egibacteraceae bacterium]|nr:hypothetical protein [Egibacteraceae bacterium]